MRSLRDDEHEIGYGHPQRSPGAPPVPPGPTVGVGAASLRWKPPVDRSEVLSLLAYLRSCLRREAVHTHTVHARDLGTDACVCLPAGHETLFSGARETLVLPSDAARVLSVARRLGQTPRYGYPLVILGEGADRVALPLLVVDVAPVDDSQEASPASGDTLVRAVGPPDVNPALLRLLDVTDPEDLFEIRARLRAGAPDPARRPAAVSDLAARVRLLLAHLEIERVDDIAPLGTRGAPRTDTRGAHNVAVLLRAGPGGREETDAWGPRDVEDVLADLDPSSGQNGLDPAAVTGTALGALLGPGPVAPCEGVDTVPTAGTRRGGRTDSRHGARGLPPSTETAGDDDSVVPICVTELGQSQYEVLRVAMRERLTVVAAPPGSGVHDLVDSLVRTAVGNGRRVLVCAQTEADLARIDVRAEAPPALPLIRTGGHEHRSAEIPMLDRLLLERARSLSEPCTDPYGADPEEHRAALAEDWARVRRMWRAMDTMASGGHALARLAEERGRAIARGWDPDALFTPERGGPEYWWRRAERARQKGMVGLHHRTAIRRELGVATDPAALAELCEVARLESEWRAAVDRRTRCAPLGELTEELTDALARHRRSSAGCLRAVVEPRLRRGHAAIENRLEALNWQRGNGRPGLENVLDTLPAWACRTDQVRALPPRAGLFDLVVVLGAERPRVAELLPVLYRADRAVVFGDPVHPGPTSALEPAEESLASAAAGLTVERLDERGLRHGTGSAMRALYRSAPPMLWLDEHDGAPPGLAETASRHCYGGRLSVRTAPDLTGEPVFEWWDVAGVCEPAPGASHVNRDEAYRVTVVVDELDAHLPPALSLVVITPTQPQVALIRRLLSRRVHRRDVRVGGPDLLSVDRDAVDVTVLSPVLASHAPADAQRRILRMSHLWSSVLTRTRRRLVVVGDRGYWSGRETPLADLDASASDTVVRTDPAVSALVEELRRARTEVTFPGEVGGLAADMAVGFGSRRLLLLLDREPDGRSLRHLLARGDSLNRATGESVVVVPAWRCLADPRTLVKEILTAH